MIIFTHARSFAWLLASAICLLATSAATAQTASSTPLSPPTAAAPANGAADVSINTTLAWAPVAGAKGYDVYFGQEASPPFQCRVTNPTFILETLTVGKTYHWHADAITDAGTKAGDAMSFTTTAKADRDAMYAWSIRMADTIRGLYPDPARLGEWNYTQGMVADALYAIALRTGRTADIDYVQKWLDRFVADDGTIDPKAYDFKLHSLDRIRPGPALLWMYDHTKNEKYLKAAQELIKQMDEQDRTPDGGFWHRSTYPNQMWLDGIYMADVFLAQYAAKANQPKYADEAVKQIVLINQHTHDPKTGLNFHGWLATPKDPKTARPWANLETGDSPEIWGRAQGWYAMAMGEVLDWLPADHPGRKEVLPIFQDLCKSLLKYQDHDTGMWWQIIDKPTGHDNYVETSCSIMFAEAFAKGAQRGWLPPEYLEYARRATRGILNKEIDLLPNDRLAIRGTVGVGSLGGNGGFYDYYVGVPLTLNDQKSLGAFMYLSMVLSETANDTGPMAKEFPKHNP